MTFQWSIHIYICQSRDCRIFSLVTVLGNMYNLCNLHSLICMCRNMCSGCHSLSKCTFLYNYRYKYGYETPLMPLHPLPAPQCPWWPLHPCCHQPYTPCHPNAPLTPLHPIPVQASSGQQWYYCRSAWYVSSLWIWYM